MTTADHKPQILAFLAQFFGEHRLAEDEDIFATGFVNSLFVMQLVLFVEGEFGITVEDEDLEIGNFNTVLALDALVTRKRAVGAADRSA
ncbi:acyl carrier protein [Kitasatospora camelliae]|uniref:Phosphopantetheine-binding protein n=1 Tax=Kitasatospora camelliae TaxID=3156397 RepID=A0AAU8K050_9ACTN